jgi:F-type H+-transporting ATPase subunit b
MRSHHALWIALLVVLASAGPLLAASAAAGATIDPSAQQPEQEPQQGSSAEPPAAAHGEGHGAEESPSIFAGDLGIAVWSLAIFLVLLFVLGRYAWGPLLQGLQDRERFIRESLEQARDERDESHALLASYEAKLAEARGEVEEILDEARRDARVVRQREEEKAREEAEALIARAWREIDIATETAVKDLYAKASRLSVDVARKILQRELEPEDHARLIDDAVRSFENRKTH